MSATDGKPLEAASREQAERRRTAYERARQAARERLDALQQTRTYPARLD